MNTASGWDPGRRNRIRLEHHEITPEPTPEEHAVLVAALELALAGEAKAIPASGWSSPQYRDGSSLRPGQRIWTSGEESDAPKRPGYPYSPRN